MASSVKDQGGVQSFRPRARLLTTLGAELISSEVVAVIELVRNSWDADATQVVVEFQKPHLAHEARVLIRDDGHGMTREVLLGPWFEPATSHKGARDGMANGGERSPGGRRRLGAKGVGRFAAQRLGRRLDLVTRAATSREELAAVFDWATIEKEDGYLDEVRIPWKVVVPAERLPAAGTILEISELRDVWTWDRFEKLRIGLSRLLSQRLDRGAFRIVLSVDGQETIIEPALDDSLAMYSIRGAIRAGGECTIEYRDQTGAIETWERRVLWPQNTEGCGAFEFHINAWDLDKPALTWFLDRTGSRLGLRDFRRLVREHSGISLYRDGFRILPYGEPDNDWLRLDRRRVNNPTLRLSNNQILGQIHLSADCNPGLKDQTNREGLVVNDEYMHLQHVAIELLAYLENRRFSARRTMPVGIGRGNLALPFSGTSAASTVLVADGVGAAREGRKGLERDRGRTNEAIQAWAGLAAIGQLSGLVFRQLDHPLRQAQTELKRLQKSFAGSAVPDDDLPTLRQTVDRVAALVADLQRRMTRLEPLATPTETRATLVPLRACVEPVLEAFTEELQGLGIVHDLEGDLNANVEVAVAPVQQAVANIIDNAVHWLAHRRDTRRLVITLERTGIRLWNNGPPIEAGDRELVFEPHYTRREGVAGLGLTVARDLVAGIGGGVEVLAVTDGAAFLVSFTRPT